MKIAYLYLIKVMNDIYDQIEVKHPIFLSEKLDYDLGFLYKKCLIWFAVPLHLVCLI